MKQYTALTQDDLAAIVAAVIILTVAVLTAAIVIAEAL